MLIRQTAPATLSREILSHIITHTDRLSLCSSCIHLCTHVRVHKLLIHATIPALSFSSADTMTSSSAEPNKPSPETLQLIEAVLDYIRSNLNNIRNALGVESPQYKAAAEIMEKHLDENLKRLKVDKSDIADLMSSMSLRDDQQSGGDSCMSK